jgi:hypothetical protein
MVATGYCPRGPFCAFAHVEAELKNQELVNSDFDYENLLASVFPKETEESLDIVDNSDVVQQLKKQTELNNKLEILCCQYRMVCYLKYIYEREP